MATADAAPAVAIGTAALFELPGMFTPDTSVADLRRHFGEHNVAVTEIDGAEGETMRGVRLFAGDPARTADVYFQDPATLRGLQTVAIRSPRSQWSLDGGVRIGMTLAELVAANRAPVTFYGFEWDYGGTVSDWNGGTFAAPLGRAARRNVQLQPRDEVDGFQRGPLPTGDNTFRSDDRKRPTIGDDVVVGAIGIGFARDDDR